MGARMTMTSGEGGFTIAGQYEVFCEDVDREVKRLESIPDQTLIMMALYYVLRHSMNQCPPMSQVMSQAVATILSQRVFHDPR